ncbi:hypothetical protein HZH68_002273 [Vespula germanica]|uniref:Uncharacterized protein n=1 Tax=Vespula germanica TaxID=30212 RepID=A0A834KTL1_VESGE|nr:hypothetical protein HZH68_002273 [Vespula germanica]
MIHNYLRNTIDWCEEATEVETHHQQTAATTMGVAEDDTPSSLTSHPNLNTNNPGQEGIAILEDDDEEEDDEEVSDHKAEKQKRRQ